MATNSREILQSHPLMICFCIKFMIYQKKTTTFGTDQGFVQQIVLWPNTDIYKRNNQTEQNSFAIFMTVLDMLHISVLT